MSTTIDQRVVEMQFDNRHFERNVETSMSTLDKLKQSLNLTGASKGLEDVSTAARGINLSPLVGAAETVGVKFNAMWTIADQALRNITNSVYNTAQRMVSALTIDPIKTGLSEYETQINAVQTILANTESKGTTLGQVNAALDELNTYADKTIYNFTEMTRNIGTFTAAGIDLNTSVNAIQGIANLAAVSGSTSQQASTAMYQLSQALSSGTVKLMDWNSVVNAGMGGQVFQDALKETSRHMADNAKKLASMSEAQRKAYQEQHGYTDEQMKSMMAYSHNVDKIIEKNGSFRESLQEGWITADVLTETLSHFTMAAEEGSKEWEAYKKSLMDDGYTEEQAISILKLSKSATDAATKVKTATQLWDTLKETAQSGWTQTWEIVMGDFGEAKKLFTEIYETLSPMIDSMSQARNKLLSEGLSSGWKQLMSQGIPDEEGYRESIKNIAKEHNIAIDDMIKAEKELDSSLTDEDAFQNVLQKGLKDGSITSDMLSESVTHLADKMRNMTDAEREAAGYTADHILQIEKLEEGLKDGSISMDEFVKKIQRPSGRENLIESLWNAFKGVLSVVQPIKEAFGEIFPALTGEQLYGFTESLKEFTSKLTLSETASNNLKRTFKGLFAVLDIVKQAFGAVFKAISPLFGKVDDLGGGILEVTAGWGDWLVALNESIKNSGFFTKAVEKIHSAFEKVGTVVQKIGDFLKPALEGIKEFGRSISDAFVDISSKASIRLEPLAVLGEFLKGVFVAIGKAIEKVAPFIFSAVKAIGGVLGSLMKQISDAVQGLDYNTLFDVTNGGIFAAIGVFIAKFIKSGGDVIDNVAGLFDEEEGIIGNIKGVLSGVSDALNTFQESLKADILKKIAIAIGILAASLLVLSLIDSERLGVALAAITAMFIELIGSLTIFSKLGDMKGVTKIAAAMISLSAALLILSVALKIMSTMSWSEMGVGLISMVVGLGALVGAVNLLPENKVNGAAKAIKKMCTALLILAVAIKIMSTMSWEEMGIGLITMVVGLGALVGAVNLLPKDTALRAAGMIGLATAMVVLGAALKIMATLSWGDIARSLVTLAGSLAILAGAMHLMKTAVPGAIAMMIVAPALVVLSGALKIMSGFSWEEIAKGLVALAGSLAIIAGAMYLMTGALPGALALVVVTAALLLFTPVLMALGSMSWGEIARGLVALAGGLAIIGIAGALLAPIIPAILGLSGAVALLGIACTAIGVGVAALGAGLAAISVAGGAAAIALTTIVSSLIGLIPFLIEQIGVGIIALCQVIAGSAAAICEAVTVIVLAVVDACIAAVPALVEGIFVLIDSLLESLVNHTPTIVGALFDFLINLINAVAEKLPDLIQAGVNLLMSFFQGVIDALSNIDPMMLLNGIIATGLLAGLVAALAAIAALVPAAMVGVLGIAGVVAELTLVLAAIGGLAQIPGLEWLISEGGNFLQTVGTAIGQFVGGLVGGFGQGVSGSLPQIGADLSAFMDNASGFIEGAKGIDSSAIDGVKSLVGVILALTGANLIEGLTSWLTGGSSLTKFGEEIAAFGPHIKAYADAVTGIDGAAVESSANAALALAEMTKHIPNEGGVVGWFAGENSIAKFGTELVTLGMCLSMYSMAITGFNGEAVIASANAAAALADMTAKIPNEGGVVAWFAGENSISKWGTELVTLGMSLALYSMAITGFNAEAVTASVNAATALADMTSNIPNSGGLVAWFTGENSVASFANELVVLGYALKGYSDSVVGMNVEAVMGSIGVASAIVDMSNKIPNEGGIVSWFTGENSLANFAWQLPVLGMGLQMFSTSVEGINVESSIAAVSVAKSVADLTSVIPNEGGIVSWFTGENSLANFAWQLPVLGMGLQMFSTSVEGINVENSTAAVGVARTIADLTSVIPNEGGIKAWFSGDNSISGFAWQLPVLGKGLMGFSSAVEGLNPENVTAAANAAKALAQMATIIPNEGGIKAWFSGDNSIASFAWKLPILGDGIKNFSDSVKGINPGAIVPAVNAAKLLVEMASATPENSSKLTTFGANLATFGDKLKAYFDKVKGISPDNVSTARQAVYTINTISNSLAPDKVKQAANAIEDMVDAIGSMSKIKAGAANNFNNAVKKIAETNVESMIKTFENSGTKMSDAGKNLIVKFTEGVKSQNGKMTECGKTAIGKFVDGLRNAETSIRVASNKIVSLCVTNLKSAYSSFRGAGAYLASGFAAGISSNAYMAKAKAKAMAAAAAQAAKKELDEHSPSRVGYEIGDYFGIAFVNSIADNITDAYNTSKELAASARMGLSEALSKASDFISSDIDAQPTIRPVLDLSDVKAGMGTIGSMFGSSSLGVSANVNAVSSMMSGYGQNGTNDDIINAIDKLNKRFDSIGNTTYQINGITYDDGSNIFSALQQLVRAARIEGRV